MKNRSCERLHAAMAVGPLLVLVAVVAIACGGSGGSSSSPTSPNTIVGSGTVVSQNRAVSGINGVRLTSVARVNIRQGSTEALTVQAEDNLMPHLITEVVGGILEITTAPGVSIQNTRDIEMDLRVRTLDMVEMPGVGSIVASGLRTNSLTLRLSGVGNFRFSGLDANRLNVTLSGVGDIVVSGRVQQQSVTVSGLGEYEARDLNSNETEVTISASGSATVRVSNRLTATITGSGNVYYVGNPTVVENISGSGQCIKING